MRIQSPRKFTYELILSVLETFNDTTLCFSCVSFELRAFLMTISIQDIDRELDREVMQ